MRTIVRTTRRKSGPLASCQAITTPKYRVGKFTYIVPRNNGGTYAISWAAAMASKPDWITITTFNEWFERSTIEPIVHFLATNTSIFTKKYATQIARLTNRLYATRSPITPTKTNHYPESTCLTQQKNMRERSHTYLRVAGRSLAGGQLAIAGDPLYQCLRVDS